MSFRVSLCKIQVLFAGPIMFLAYAVYMIARKIMAKRGFTQVSSASGVAVIYLLSSSVYILKRLFSSYNCALPDRSYTNRQKNWSTCIYVRRLNQYIDYTKSRSIFPVYTRLERALVVISAHVGWGGVVVEALSDVW